MQELSRERRRRAFIGMLKCVACGTYLGAVVFKLTITAKLLACFKHMSMKAMFPWTMLLHHSFRECLVTGLCFKAMVLTPSLLLLLLGLQAAGAWCCR
jgi:hypothetical protein